MSHVSSINHRAALVVTDGSENDDRGREIDYDRHHKWDHEKKTDVGVEINPAHNKLSGAVGGELVKPMHANRN